MKPANFRERVLHILFSSVVCLCILDGIHGSSPGTEEITEETSGSLTSPNYPNDYPQNAQKRTRISVAENKVCQNVIKLEWDSPYQLESAWMSDRCYDYLQIYDTYEALDLAQLCNAAKTGPKPVCGMNPPSAWYSNGNVTVIDFCSDENIEMAGYQIHWTAVDPPPAPTTPANYNPINVDCGRVSTKYPGDISFFPNHTIDQIAASRSEQTEADDANEIRRFIVGGAVSPSHAWPWAASIWRQTSGTVWNQFCGGSILTDHWVLTAAHCMHNHPTLDQFKLKFGAFDKGVTPMELNEPTQQVCGVRKVVIHPQFDSEKASHDIALIQLDCTLSFNDAVTNICIPPQGNAMAVKDWEHIAIVGWGHTAPMGSSSSLLKEAVVVAQPQTSCIKAYGSKIDSTMFCADNPNTDSCQGDSGGPAMSHIQDGWYQSGIVSWGKGCGDSNYPGVYVRVAQFYDWILKTVKED